MKLRVPLALVALLLTIPAIGNAAIVESDVVSWWELDEESGVRSDEAANANDLTDNNTVTYGTGKDGNSAKFTKTNSEYLSISDGSQTGLDITGDLTMSAWIKKTTDFGNGQIMGKFDGNGGASSRGYALHLDANTSTSLDINISNGTTATWKYVTWAPTTGTWYHVAAVYDASAGSVEFYVDGSQQGTTQTGLPTSITNNSQAFQIGAHSGGGSYIDGEVDIAIVFDRALTSAEISDLYNSGSPQTYADMFGSGTTTSTSTATTTTSSTTDVSELVWTFNLYMGWFTFLFMTFIGYRFARIFV